MAQYRKLKVAYNAIIDNHKINSTLYKNKSRQKLNKVFGAVLHITGTGSCISSPSLGLTVTRGELAKSFYSFNCNSAAVRVVKRTYFNKMRAVFYTRNSHRTQGDAVNSLLSLKHITQPYNDGRSVISCYGPPGIMNYTRKLYNYLLSPLIRERFFERVKIVEDDSEYVDENISVKKLTLDPRIYDVNDDSDDFYARPTTSYICQIHSFPNQVDLEQCREKHGIDLLAPSFEKIRHSFLRELIAEKVALHPITGKEISSEGLLKQYTPTLIFLDCPTEQHLKCLEEDHVIKNHFQGSDGVAPSMMAHITPQSLFSSQRYQSWIENFGSSCKHIVLNQESKIYYEQAHCAQILNFNKISNQLFPSVFQQYIHNNCNNGSMEAISGLSFEMKENGKERVHHGTIVDKEKYDEISCEIEEVFQNENDIVEQVQQDIGLAKDPACADYYPRLVVLGCGATTTINERGQPGFLFMLNEETSIVLDCGAQVLDKIHLIFGEKAEDVLATINLVFVSHRHFDHMAGFFPLIENVVKVKRRRKLPGKVFCLMPSDIVSFYKNHLRNWETAIHDKVDFCSVEGAWNRQKPDYENLVKVQGSLGLQRLMPIPVQHSVQTYGIIFITQCGKKIVYTSDTLPMSKHVLQEGKNADLLIHDCLYVDEDWKMDAKVRKHSTLSGVIQTADATKAKFTLLTHFSAFLPILPVSDKDWPDNYKDKMACAYDNVCISVSDLPKLTKLEPAIAAVYRDKIQRFLADLQRRQIQRQKIRKTVENLVDIF